MRGRRRRGGLRAGRPALTVLAGLLTCGAVAFTGTGCEGAPDALEIHLRSPPDPTLLDGVDTFVFSVEDGQGRPLVLRRFEAALRSLRLDEIPYGRRLTFRLEGLFRETPILRGRTCPAEVVAGRTRPSLSMFLSRVGSFSRVEDPAERVRRHPLVFVRPDGAAVVAGGGAEDGIAVATAERFEPTTGAWEREAPLAGSRRLAEVAPYGEGEAVVVGGEDEAGAPVGRVEAYRPGLGFRVVASDPDLGRTGLRSTALPDGRVLITGGAVGAGPASARAVIYDRGELRPAGAMAAGRRAHSVSAVGSGAFSAAFVIGGEPAAGAQALPDIELFNPRATPGNEFTPEGARLGRGRADHTATVLATGEILVVGGRNGTAPLASAEIFDPTTRSVRSAGALERARSGHAASLLRDGRVLVTGGTGPSGEALGSAELFDPTLSTFAAARPLAVERADHAQVDLCDGTVLLVGGGLGAEVYNPVR